VLLTKRHENRRNFQEVLIVKKILKSWFKRPLLILMGTALLVPIGPLPKLHAESGNKVLDSQNAENDLNEREVDDKETEMEEATEHPSSSESAMENEKEKEDSMDRHGPKESDDEKGGKIELVHGPACLRTMVSGR